MANKASDWAVEWCRLHGTRLLAAHASSATEPSSHPPSFRSVKCSYLELYNEEITDLLAVGADVPKVRASGGQAGGRQRGQQWRASTACGWCWYCTLPVLGCLTAPRLMG